MRETDILVVGAGPAGLHAALKAAALNHSVLVIDKGRRFSRVSQAHAIANVPGHPGISGMDLLEQGRRDLARFADVSGKRLAAIEEDAEVVELARAAASFRARVRQDGAEWWVRAATVVLATGVVDRKPGIGAFEWAGHHTLSPYIRTRSLGYCLLCEGWALEGKRVAVIGHSKGAAQIADDVRHHFDAQVTLLTDGREAPRPAHDVQVDARPIADLRQDDRLAVAFEDGAVEHFDKALFGLGWHKVNSDLVRPLGAKLTEEGHVVTDENREVLAEDGSVIRGLFAIGDVRAGPWKQIPLAWADAELAMIAAYAYRLE